MKDILRRAILLGASRKEIEAADYSKRVAELDDELTFHLRDRVFKDPDDQK